MSAAIEFAIRTLATFLVAMALLCGAGWCVRAANEAPVAKAHQPPTCTYHPERLSIGERIECLEELERSEPRGR